MSDLPPPVFDNKDNNDIYLEEDTESEYTYGSDEDVEEDEEDGNKMTQQLSIMNNINQLKKDFNNLDEEYISEEQRQALTDYSVSKDVSKKKNKFNYKEVASQIHYHASSGKLDVLEELLKENPDSIEAPTEDGRTILHISASFGHLPVVKMLLEHGANIEAKMDNGITPLMLSAAKGKSKVITLLLNQGADLSSKTTEEGYTCLHLAAMNQQLESAKAILSHCRGCNDKKKMKILEEKTIKGRTPLMYAVVEDDYAMVKLFCFEYRADIHACTENKYTALHFAAYVGSLQICRYLVFEKCADALAKTTSNERAYDIAVSQGNKDLFKLLHPQNYSKKKKKKKDRGPPKTFTERFLLEQKDMNDDDQSGQIQMILPPPNFGANSDKKSILEIFKDNPKLMTQMQENPNLFLEVVPPEIQHIIVAELQNNPQLMEELIEIGKEVLIEMLENHPDEILNSMGNPMNLLKKAKTPNKLRKLLKDLEKNPMMVLKDGYQDDPEMFFLEMIQDNPRILHLTVNKVAETKPHLLPLVTVVLGINPGDDFEAPEKQKKNFKGKVQSKVLKGVTSTFARKLVNNVDKSDGLAAKAMGKQGVDIAEVKQDLEDQLSSLREYLDSDDVKAWQKQYQEYKSQQTNNNNNNNNDILIEDPD